MDVIPDWIAKVTPSLRYDRHTMVTGHCHHGNHARCTSPHGPHNGHHTTIVGRDGYPIQWRGGPIVSVSLTVDECSGCHCECHRNAQMTLDVSA